MPYPAQIAMLALLAIPTAFSQTADDLYFFGRRDLAAGARMTAMGGAGVAGLGDWNAAATNPAGLGYLRSRQAVVSGHGHAAGIQQYGNGFDGETEGFSIGTASFAAPLPTARGALAVGIGYNETAIYTRVSDAPALGGLGAFHRAESGFQGELSVAGAMAVAPSVMLGLSVNAPIGHYSFDESFFDGDGETPSFDADIYGANMRAGVSFSASPALRIGLAIESPTILNVDETAPALGRKEYRIATPWRVAVGVLASSPRALVAADVELVDWSQARFLTDGRQFDEENAVAARRLHAVLETRVGGEFLLGAVALRAGAAFQPDPRFESFRPEAVRQHYSLGIGVRVSRSARIDAAFTHTRLADGPRGALFDGEGYLLWDVDHAYRNSIEVGADLRF